MSTMPAPSAGADRFAATAAVIADPVRRDLWRRTDAVTADDVLTATLGVLRERAADLPLDAPVPWALGVARLQLQNARRMQRRQTLLAQRLAVVDPPRLHDDDASDSDDAARLALARLREHDAELLRLWAWEGLDASGIATVLGSTPEDVATRLGAAGPAFAELRDAERSGAGGVLDEKVRAVLLRIDPARPLPALTPDELAAQLADATRTPGSSAPAPRRRSPWLIAGVGAVSAGAAAALLLPFALGAVDGGAATALRLPSTGGPTASCAPVTADALAPAELAFRAEVSSVEGNTVTLHVIERFAGKVGDSIEVTQAPESAVDGAPLVFETGVDYLITADGTTILTCGLSGPDSPELTQLYREAFASR